MAMVSVNFHYPLVIPISNYQFRRFRCRIKESFLVMPLSSRVSSYQIWFLKMAISFW